MPDFTKWIRKDFGDTQPVPQRPRCEEETNQDLQKPIQQLICDVFELAKVQGVSPEKMQLFVAARLAAMFGRVALEHERVNKGILFLTKVIVGLTVVLVILTIVIIVLTVVLVRHGG